MNKSTMNNQLNLVIDVANNLIKEGKINSFREFSCKYLNKSSNYLGTLVYQNKYPSIASILTLYLKLNQEKQMSNWQNKLLGILKNSIIKE